MDLRVAHTCPQCGAAVDLAESDRLLTCPFCGVKNYLLAQGGLRYVLPQKVAGGNVLQAPYIRFKGSVFVVSEKGVSQRIVDTTQQGNVLHGLPPSLGFRPQAMPLTRVTAQTEGRFLPQAVKALTILKKAAQLSDLEKRSGSTMYHRAYIGETLSFIYLPLLLQENRLMDGVTNKVLSLLPEGFSLAEQSREFNPGWEPRYLSTICPQCGWGLDGEGDCLVLTCANCQTVWELGAKGLISVEWAMARSSGNASCWLPFWSIAAQIPNLDIESFADFAHKTRQTFVVRPQWHERRMRFLVPAFKIRPKIFLQIAKRLTVAQYMLSLEPGRTRPGLYPVTLPRSEARQAIKLTLAAACLNPKKIFPLLPQVRLKDVQTSLVYLPFQETGHDFVQEQTCAAVAKNVVRIGRSL